MEIFSTIKKGYKIRNTRSGEIGIVRGIWLNEHTHQIVFNVRVNGVAASWNIYSTGKAGV